MKKLLLLLLCVPLIGLGQVYIPDANFKAYLVGNSAINTNGDSEIQVSEAAAFNGTIDCYGMSINDLTGIEAFTALDTLNCAENQLTTLNVSQNTALTTLICAENQLTSLDVSTNTALISLECSSNQLTSLDVSTNTALIYFYPLDNLLTSLDVSANTALQWFWCNYNLLNCLDISANINLEFFSCGNNLLEELNTKNGNWQNMDLSAPLGFDNTNNNLTCVEVDNIGYATTNWAGLYDSFVTFSTNCNYTNPCATFSAIEEHTSNKELLKVTDILGREVNEKRNTPLFYIYNDGTVEKKIIIE